ncbi:LytTR family DNA-binding domain-containing protein [Tenacibaculum sp. SG-28]|uniref:LytR/AlgR family response regulator transcription factor n=1 Tax=Tenacibaculum sp. SG-28 TaxID=754426 RepID=UPI000CF3B1E5|nr:LytTR family DNA-binding domain-containing protein [Tenacibaculum sp. SG-28]PQJ21494.1 DNA-binding response regulator [Tenacibaculum sp. SG-28]
MRKTSCIIVDDEPVAREILENYIAKIPSIEVIKSCSNALEVMEVLNRQKVELLFLDINMPDISGLSLAKSIRNQTKIIFTTAYREYAIDGFDLHVVDYLLKPFSFDRFLEAIQKFHRQRQMQGNEKPSSTTNKNIADFIFVKSDRKMLKLNLKDILYLESLSDYIKIHTTEKTVITRETFANIERKIPASQFLRVHRSFIIAIAHIESFTKEHIEIRKKAIPISRGYKQEVLAKLNFI